MIELISRKEALVHPTLATHVFDLQEMQYNPEEDPDVNRNNSAFRKSKAKYAQLKDDEPKVLIALEGSYIYNLPAAPIDDYVDHLGQCLQQLAEHFQPPLTFVLDYSIPWLSQENPDEHTQAAMSYLRSIGVTADYIGAIRATEEDVLSLTKAVFWLGRLNASLPYCWFAAGSEDLIGSVCKYGNLHLDAYSTAGKVAIDAFVMSQELTEIEACTAVFVEE